MQKTAEENHFDQPQAATVDMVLATDGFKVKGWIKVFTGNVNEKDLGIEWNNITGTFSLNVNVDLLQLTNPEDPDS